jgi:chemotaxis protein CheY-P-specific phosphatase CheC
VASESLSIQLAANVLGVEEDQIDEPSAEDALKELLNVTCGKFLDELAGPQVIFNLSIPDIRIIDHAQYEALISEPGMVEMQVEYQPIYLRAKVT